MALIITEGFDNSGKTTLAQQLADRLGWQKQHSPNFKMEFTEWVVWNFQALHNSWGIVYDRFPLVSEEIYGHILRGENRLATVHGLYELFWKVNPLIIYCRPPAKTILNFGDREQMEGVIDQANSLLMGYDKFFMDLANHPDINLVVYDYTRDSLEKVTASVNRYLLDQYKLKKGNF